jgi:hypothetical protein
LSIATCTAVDAGISRSAIRTIGAVRTRLRVVRGHRTTCHEQTADDDQTTRVKLRTRTADEAPQPSWPKSQVTLIRPQILPFSISVRNTTKCSAHGDASRSSKPLKLINYVFELDHDWNRSRADSVTL